VIDKWLDEASALLASGKFERAEKLLSRVLKQAPDCADAHHLLGLVKFQCGLFDAASRKILQAIALNPNNLSYWNNLGLVYTRLGQFSKAEDCHTKALMFDSNHASTYFLRANALSALYRFDDAISDYETALNIDPYDLDCLCNFATMLGERTQYDRALLLFDKALAINHNCARVLNNKGLMLRRLGRVALAESCFLGAIESEPSYVEALVNLGNLLQEQLRYKEALPFLQKALQLNPMLDFVPGYIAHCKAMLCDWSDQKGDWQRIEKAIERGQVPATPFTFLGGSDRADLALKLARLFSVRYVQDLGCDAPYSKQPRGQGPKLRIGYVSSDYREHPMPYLMVGVLEHHNRLDFEWIAIALNPPSADPLARRILKAFDEVVDVSALSDNDAIENIRKLSLDIAIDLNGYIEGCRPAIFKARIAPVQISYYGYPGTMGAPFIDYIIGDPHLMPSGYEKYYSEKIIYLPGSYQPNDDKREISDSDKGRQDYGLPENSFVFCCLNKTYKITPDIYRIWMSILRRVPRSVLWLFAVDEIAKANLRKEAIRVGIDVERILFTGRVPSVADHLARYKCADLFLDTYPYTAHTTANDALWVGLPVLTLSGQTFSARVGESLLGALGLSHWVVTSLKAYEDCAVELATNPCLIAQFKQELCSAKKTSTLFKPAKIASILESAYLKVHQRQIEGLAPDNIIIDLPEDA
jgi:protein O-GlcNAc transferase